MPKSSNYTKQQGCGCPEMVIEFAAICTWTWYRDTASLILYNRPGSPPRISCSGTRIGSPRGQRKSPIWNIWSDGDSSGAYESIPGSGKMSSGVFCCFSDSDDKGVNPERGRSLSPRRDHHHNGSRRILPCNFVLCFLIFLETCEGIGVLSWKFPLCETTDFAE